MMIYSSCLKFYRHKFIGERLIFGFFVTEWTEEATHKADMEKGLAEASGKRSNK